MFIVIICLVVIVLICMLFWRTDNEGFATLGWVIVVICLLVAVIVPFKLSKDASELPDAIVTTYDIMEVNGGYYYLKDGKWEDVLSVVSLTQSDNLSVIGRKCLDSGWRWSISYTEAHIPVVDRKWSK